MKKKKKDKQRFMKTIFKDMGKLLSNINEDSICTWCALLDYDLLSLTDESGAKKFSNKYCIVPGYNWFLTSVYLLTEISDSSKLLSNDITNKFSKLLDEMIRKNIKRLGLSVTSQIGNSQAQWQKNYIFKTYLLYLFLSEPDVNNKLKSITNLSSFEISSICLYNKLFSQPEMKLKAEELGYKSSDIVVFLTKFLVENIPCIIINQDEYKKKQMEKIASSKYDLFSTRMIIRDYPIIKINNQYHMISYFNVQNSIFSRLVYLLKNIDSKVVGDAFERIIYNQFKHNYSHIAKDILNDDCIQLNPTQKGKELCDVLIKNGDKYLLIDCKSKEFIETIYSTNVSELETMVAACGQRLKQIESIKARKYNKILPQSIDINNVYSLIVVIDDCCFLKEELIKHLSKDIDANSKDYCQNNIDIISYDDLLEFINADVDLIDVLHRCKVDNSYFKFIRYNVKQDDKSHYSKSFDEWFDLAKEKMVDMLEEYNILNKDS